MSLVDKLKTTWQIFVEDPALFEIDSKSEAQLREINPDYGSNNLLILKFICESFNNLLSSIISN